MGRGHCWGSAASWGCLRTRRLTLDKSLLSIGPSLYAKFNGRLSLGGLMDLSPVQNRRGYNVATDDKENQRRDNVAQLQGEKQLDGNEEKVKF